MSQRRNDRSRRATTSAASKAPLVAAIVVLLIVAAIVGILIARSTGGSASDTPTADVSLAASPTKGATPVTNAAGTPIAAQDPTASPSATTGTTNSQATTTATSATSTQQPTPAPTSAQPTATPVVGSFGPLPPALLSTGNSVGRTLNFDYHLNMSLQMIPTTAPAYEFQNRQWTLDQAKTLAQSLGITGDVASQGNGTYQASGNGSLFVSGNVVQYVGAQSATPVAAPLPSSDFAIQAARNWLLQHQLVGADAGQGSITDQNKATGRTLVVIKPVEPSGILSATPSAAVTVGADGTVLEANIQWPASLQSSTYGLRGASDLWSDVTSGRAYVEISPDQLPSGPISGTVTVTSASLAYTITGGSTAKQFLVPLVVFAGQARINGADVPVKMYVQAVSAQVAPRG